MKITLLFRSVLCFLAGILLAGCEKDERDINLNLSEVTGLFSPANGHSLQLQPATNQVEVFEWEQARAEDGSLVLYEVAFDQANGDFSQPFYKVVSDGKGIQNKLTLTHGDLNYIAELGGAAFFEKKTFKWTVLASKGTHVKPATTSYTLELERPGGFDQLPGALYLTGSATEGGEELSAALKMHQVSPGVFEIYSKLKAGSYQFVDAITGSPKRYHIFDDDGIWAIGMNGQSNFAGADKVMRIRLDFNNINASYLEVKEVKLWYCAGNEFWFSLPYAGNGVWRKDGHVVNLQPVPWGLEERYKYMMVVNDGGEDRDHWINSHFGDPAGQDGQYPSSVEYRSLNLEANNGSQWDWGWKLDRNYLTQGSVADFWVSMRGSDAPYTQQYEKQ